MVCVGDEERVYESMEMGPERSRALHNFDLPRLKWGGQRLLRCSKDGAVHDDHHRRQSSAFGFERTPVGRRRREPEAEGLRRFRFRWLRAEGGGCGGCGGGDQEEEEGIEAVREKVMSDIRTAADKFKDEFLREEVAWGYGDDDNGAAAEPAEVSPAPARAPAIAADLRPWNLRTRRVACKSSSNGGGAKGLKILERKPNNSPLRSEGGGDSGSGNNNNNNGVRSPRPVRGLPEKRLRTKVTVPLTRKEIEEDFMQILGHRPPRRPNRKHSKTIQKQLDVSQ